MLTAIIVAAGSSRRMGFDKLFAQIAGRPVIAHAIAAFESAKDVAAIILVAQQERHVEFENLVRSQGFKKVHALVAGGEHRHDSVRAGLEQLPAEATYVAVHDAARPLVTPEQIGRVYHAAETQGGASLAAPVSDTLKRADPDLMVKESIDRAGVYAMQTPQAFQRQILEEAYRRVAQTRVPVTDEVSAVEGNGGQVVLVSNEQPNFKITYPGDLQLAEFVLEQRKGAR